MSTPRMPCLLLALLTIATGRAHGGVVLTFEGLQNFEQVASFYDGGTGSLGSGPGPAYGATFTSYGLAYIPGQQTGTITPFPNDPSPPTVLLLFNPGDPFGAGYPESMTMNVTAGITTALSFYDICIGRQGSVAVWSGPNGTGTMLAQLSLAITPEAFATSPLLLSFSGTAQSVVFAGGNDQLALDNIAFTLVVPEPGAWLLLTVGLAGSYLASGHGRKQIGRLTRQRPPERHGTP
jgi:hypothetical protein